MDHELDLEGRRRKNLRTLSGYAVLYRANFCSEGYRGSSGAVRRNDSAAVELTHPQ
jgi:hypothetical protein